MGMRWPSGALARQAQMKGQLRHGVLGRTHGIDHDHRALEASSRGHVRQQGVQENAADERLLCVGRAFQSVRGAYVTRDMILLCARNQA